VQLRAPLTQRSLLAWEDDLLWGHLSLGYNTVDTGGIANSGSIWLRLTTFFVLVDVIILYIFIFNIFNFIYI